MATGDRHGAWTVVLPRPHLGLDPQSEAARRPG